MFLIKDFTLLYTHPLFLEVLKTGSSRYILMDHYSNSLSLYATTIESEDWQSLINTLLSLS